MANQHGVEGQVLFFRAKFVEPFYVNVIVLPDDGPCQRLPGLGFGENHRPNITANASVRVKSIRVSIKKASEYSTYVTPIALSAIWMFTIIFIR